MDKAGYALLLMALIWAPWPLGSNRPWALALLAATVWGALILTAVASVGLGLSIASDRKRNSKVWLPVAALAVFALLLVLQLVPGLAPNGGTLSIDPFATRRYLLATLVYGGAWLLVLLAVNTPERASRLLATLVAAGVLQATAAVLLYSTDMRYVLWFASFEQGGRTTGTFVNPDHLAGYMELTLSAGLGWLLAQFSAKYSPRAQNWRAAASAVLVFILSPKMLLRLTLVVAVVALVMTHSRMGNGAFFLALFGVGALVAWRSPRLRRPSLWLVVSMALVDLLIIGQWVGLDRVVQRLQDTPVTSAPAAASTSAPVAFGAALLPQRPPSEQSLQERLQTPLASFRVVADRPWLGHGGGTYVTVFPAYKVASLDGLPLQWDNAHNDYVQVACDTGLLGLALWLSIGVASAWRAFTLLHDFETAANRGLAVAALMALSCIGLHSMVDFNLHIPANALTFTVLLALPWAVPGGTRSSGHRRQHQRSQATNKTAP